MDKANQFIIISTVCFLCILGTIHFIPFVSFKPISKQNQPAVAYISGENHTEVVRFDSISQSCGDLCDISKNSTPSHFINIRRTQVDCHSIFQNGEIDKPLERTPPKWNETSKLFQNVLTHAGTIATHDLYFDESYMGGAMSESEPHTYSQEDIQIKVESVKNGNLTVGYDGGPEDITSAIKEAVSVVDKHVLVIGSQNPWIEAILIFSGASKVTTLEYGNFVSNHPQLHYIRPDEFRDKYLDGSLPVFDLVFSFSSIEHSGLGRYGDALNPWGDILTIARAWCASSPDAKLVIAVPTNHKKDCIIFNAHRVYGPILYPFLVTNWKFNWSSTGETQTSYDGCDSGGQPVYVFTRLGTQ